MATVVDWDKLADDILGPAPRPVEPDWDALADEILGPVQQPRQAVVPDRPEYEEPAQPLPPAPTVATPGGERPFVPEPAPLQGPAFPDWRPSPEEPIEEPVYWPEPEPARRQPERPVQQAQPEPMEPLTLPPQRDPKIDRELDKLEVPAEYRDAYLSGMEARGQALRQKPLQKYRVYDPSRDIDEQRKESGAVITSRVVQPVEIKRMRDTLNRELGLNESVAFQDIDPRDIPEIIQTLSKRLPLYYKQNPKQGHRLDDLLQELAHAQTRMWPKETSEEYRARMSRDPQGFLPEELAERDRKLVGETNVASQAARKVLADLKERYGDTIPSTKAQVLAAAGEVYRGSKLPSDSPLLSWMNNVKVVEAPQAVKRTQLPPPAYDPMTGGLGGALSGQMEAFDRLQVEKSLGPKPDNLAEAIVLNATGGGLQQLAGTEYALSRTPFVGSGVEAVKLARVVEATQRLQGGDAGASDYQLVADYVMDGYREGEKGFVRRVADVASMFPAFGAEIFLTGGLMKGGAKLGEKALKNTVEGALKKVVKQSLAKRLAQSAVVKGAGTVAGGTLGLAGMAAVNPKTMAVAQRRRLQHGETLAEALPKGLVDTMIELGSEYLGGQFGKLWRLIPKGRKLTALTEAFDKLSRSNTATGKYLRVLRAGQLQEPISESLEERAAEAGRAITGLEQWPDYASKEFWDQVAVELVAFSVPMGAAGGVRALDAAMTPQSEKDLARILALRDKAAGDRLVSRKDAEAIKRQLGMDLVGMNQSERTEVMNQFFDAVASLQSQEAEDAQAVEASQVTPTQAEERLTDAEAEQSLADLTAGIRRKQQRFKEEGATRLEQEIWSDPATAAGWAENDPEAAQTLAEKNTYRPKDFEEAGLPVIPDPATRKRWKGWVQEYLALPEDARAALKKQPVERPVRGQWTRVPEGVDPPRAPGVEVLETPWGTIIRMAPGQARQAAQAAEAPAPMKATETLPKPAEPAFDGSPEDTARSAENVPNEPEVKEKTDAVPDTQAARSDVGDRARVEAGQVEEPAVAGGGAGVPGGGRAVRAVPDAEAQAEAKAPAKRKQAAREPGAAPESPWVAESRQKLEAVPVFEGAQFEFDEDLGTARVTRPDGRATTIHFDAETREAEAWAALEKKKGKAKGAYVYKKGKKGRFQEGHIYLRSDAKLDTLNHEVIHWLEDEGVITPEEVAEHGGREGLASQYGEWVASRQGRPTEKPTIFDRIYDFLKPIFSSRERFFRDIRRRGLETAPETQPGPAKKKLGKPAPGSTPAPGGPTRAAHGPEAAREAQPEPAKKKMGKPASEPAPVPEGFPDVLPEGFNEAYEAGLKYAESLERQPGNSGIVDAVTESVRRSAWTYKPGKGTSFRTYAQNLWEKRAKSVQRQSKKEGQVSPATEEGIAARPERTEKAQAEIDQATERLSGALREKYPAEMGLIDFLDDPNIDKAERQRRVEQLARAGDKPIQPKSVEAQLRRARRKIKEAAESDPELRKLLDEYDQTQQEEAVELGAPASHVLGAAKTTRLGGGAKTVVSLFRRFFTAKGELTEESYDAKMRKEGYVAREGQRARQLGVDLRRAVRKALSQNEMTEEGRNALNAVLRGEASINTVPEAVREPLLAFRDHIDALSRILIAEGVAQGDLIGIIARNHGVYATRSYRVFDDPKWRKHVPEEVRNRALAWLRSEYPERTDEQINGLLESLLLRGVEAGSPVALLKGSQLGQKDLSIFTRRKDIPEPIRELWGEYKDAGVNYARSIYKMANLIANHRFLNEVREAGLGKWLRTAEDGPAVNEWGEVIAKIAADESKVMAPLNGLYTTPEIKAAFDRLEGGANMPNWLRYFMAVNSVVKYSKTVGSAVTHVRNYISGAGFAVSNGHWRVGEAKDAFKATVTDLANLPNQEMRDLYLRLTELKVVGEDVRAGELQDALRDASKQDIDEYLYNTEARHAKKIVRAGRASFAFINRLYQAEDAVWKIYGWKNEVARYRKAHPEWTQQQVEEHAAKIVRDTYPTYSKIGEGVKSLRRFPVLGTFVSFPAEVVRTQFNTLRIGMEEMRDPRTRAIGAQRFVGSIVSLTALGALSKATMAMLGLTDDEDGLIRLFVAPWQKNSRFLYLGRKPGGKYKYVDLGYSDPHAWISDAVTAFCRGESLDDSIRMAAEEFAQPFLSKEILFKAIVEAISNKRDDTGGEIYNPEDTALKKGSALTDHLLDTVTPGTVTSLQRIYRGATGYVSEHGRTYDTETEIFAVVFGQRIQDLDIEQSLSFRIRDFEKQVGNIERILRSSITRKGTVTGEQVTSDRDRVESLRKKAFSEMQRTLGAARRLGVPPEKINLMLYEAGLSEVDRWQLLSGSYVPYQVSKATLSRMHKAAPEQYEDRFQGLSAPPPE